MSEVQTVLEQGIWLALENAGRLHQDAMLLHRKKRYRSSVGLSVFAKEEIGKMLMLVQQRRTHSSFTLSDWNPRGKYLNHQEKLKALGNITYILDEEMAKRHETELKSSLLLTTGKGSIVSVTAKEIVDAYSGFRTRQAISERLGAFFLDWDQKQKKWFSESFDKGQSRRLLESTKKLLGMASEWARKNLGEPADVCRLQIPSQTNSASRCRYFAPRERIDSDSAIALAHKLLAKRPVRTLILVNRPVTLRRWLQDFQDAAFDSRVIGILGGDGSRKRLEKFSEFMSRKDSILLTNSTVFWEGINIKQLRILIITEEPNPRPNLVDLYNGRSRKFSHIVRNRMTQGMGRIGREPGTDAICLILFPYKDARVTQFDCSSASVEKTVQLLSEID